jgi:hypothetical protein
MPEILNRHPYKMDWLARKLLGPTSRHNSRAINTTKRQKVNSTNKPSVLINMAGKYNPKKNPLLNNRRPVTLGINRQNSFFKVNKTRKQRRSRI